MRKLLCLMAALLLLLLLAACGQGGSPEPEAAAPGEQSSPPPSAPAETPAEEPEATAAPAVEEPEVTAAPAAESPETTEEKEETTDMTLRIGDTPVTVQWEENPSVDALRELVREAPLTIQLSMYGGFEQVGPIGQRLPRDDVQTTTAAGDIVLYSGNQIVIFYGSNSWAYTRLGHISQPDAAALEQLLGRGDVSITLGF